MIACGYLPAAQRQDDQQQHAEQTRSVELRGYASALRHGSVKWLDMLHQDVIGALQSVATRAQHEVTLIERNALDDPASTGAESIAGSDALPTIASSRRSTSSPSCDGSGRPLVSIAMRI